MGTITRFRERKVSDEGRAERAGELVALRDIDIDCVIETVRALRSLDDPSLLDCFNRKDRARRALADD
ncbi:hypothetical protein MesoLjLc_04660 [Mesorhizobium sp. L-8-10]|uniref:hypothetical protein n=1 Tax=unclassified Mesorhizobium TaxID=325217 RepID=UPI001927C704|nr:MULTISPECIES: hypothetical protein [unclassified Mesorhizobium]BCH20692.1 hypothetical protein MesoLjLb_04770 [Mesorhizobium sp. L-8-3]BCH28536.1 hypothetical protein MesoLjLc_04660 [Mesorhizobium sp. L-8-10]